MMILFNGCVSYDDDAVDNSILLLLPMGRQHGRLVGRGNDATTATAAGAGGGEGRQIKGS